MESKIYPLKFLPLYKNVIWGGNRLKDYGFNYDPLPNCGELWALSAVEGRESVIANGFLADNTLNEAIEIYMGELVGDKALRELGITVSVGVSWNKIYAKFGSDYKKPDAITVIDRNNYRNIVWKSPASDLLFVGRATQRKLLRYGILTIGDLAQADPAFLQAVFGKIGLVLSAFARGEDNTPVAAFDDSVPIKSVGNSTTTPRDLVSDTDVRMVLYLLSESVAARLRENHFIGDVIGISIRDNVRKAGAGFRVTKNRIARLALKDTKFEGIADLFTGPTAIAFASDPVAACKACVEFAKTNEKLIVLGGAMGTKVLSVKEVEQLLYDSYRKLDIDFTLNQLVSLKLKSG